MERASNHIHSRFSYEFAVEAFLILQIFTGGGSVCSYIVCGPLTGIQAGMHCDILAYTRHTCFSGIVRSLLPSYFQGTGFHSLGQGHVAKLVALRFLSDGRDRRHLELP